MNILLGSLLFFLILGGPLVVLMIWMEIVRRRPYRKVIPYVLIYIAALSLGLGWISGLRGWELFAILAICTLGAFLVMRAWVPFQDDLDLPTKLGR